MQIEHSLLTACSAYLDAPSLIELFPLHPSPDAHRHACQGAHGPHWPPNTPWLDLKLCCDPPTWPSSPCTAHHGLQVRSSESTNPKRRTELLHHDHPCAVHGKDKGGPAFLQHPSARHIPPQQSSRIQLSCEPEDIRSVLAVPRLVIPANWLALSTKPSSAPAGKSAQVAADTSLDALAVSPPAAEPSDNVQDTFAGAKQINDRKRKGDSTLSLLPALPPEKPKKRQRTVDATVPREPRLDSKGRYILFEKTLFESDIKERQNRLMIGKYHTGPLFEKWGKPAVKCDIPVTLLDDEDNEVFDLKFGHWGSSEAYVIKGGWCRYGKKKNLRNGDILIISVDANGTCYVTHKPTQRCANNLLPIGNDDHTHALPNNNHAPHL